MAFSSIALRSIVAVAALLLAACSTWERPALVRSSSGQMVCRVHRIPLRSVPAFELDPWILMHASAERHAFEQKFPNAFPLGYAMHRSKDFPTPGHAEFCPKCEHELLKVFPDKTDSPLRNGAR